MPDTGAALPNKVVRVRSCQGCPFAHLEAGDLFTRYCCLHPKLPDVSDYFLRGKMPNFCPLLQHAHRVFADVIFSTPG